MEWGFLFRLGLNGRIDWVSYVMREVDMKVTGISGSRGVAVGTVYRYEHEEIVIPDYKVTPEGMAEEVEKLDKGLTMTLDQLESIRIKALSSMGQKEAAIFEAHKMIAQDPTLADGIKSLIQGGTNVAAATQQVVDQFASIFLGMEDPYMRERGADIKDIGDRLIRNVLGMTPRGLSHLTGQVILVAHDLAPSDTASLDTNVVKGIVTAAGGVTSHAAIMARTLEIPAVMGVGDITSFAHAKRAIVLGSVGEVIVDPDDHTYDKHIEFAKRYRDQLASLKQSANLPAITKDGVEIHVFGNIGKPEGAEKVLANGGAGIGLYRTEFLFMEHDSLPSEDEQFEAYKKVAQTMDGKAVIIRTMDIGGDKELKCLDLPEEMNPFLGYRAIRISLTKPDIFKTQLRALLRASAYGDVHIMYPMITSIEEVKAANAILDQAKDELRQEGQAFREDIKVGIMVEVPATAVSAFLFAKHVDFFSIGTNDLCQYTLAVDRMNETITNLYQPMHPSILRLIKTVIEASHDHKKFTGMCGEMAGDPLLTMILIGMGLDEFSMSAPSIPIVKHIIRSVTLQECKSVLDTVMTMETAEEIHAYAQGIMAEKGLNWDGIP